MIPSSEILGWREHQIGHAIVPCYAKKEDWKDMQVIDK
jgi:hypothetical protein